MAASQDNNANMTQQAEQKKKSNGTHNETIRKEQLETRINEEIRLRGLGYDYRQIGAQLGVHFTVVYRDVQKVLAETRKETAETAEEIRQMELERIDSVLPQVLTMARKGDLKAVDSLVKLMDRRSKYLGLDAVQKQEQSGMIKVVYLDKSTEGVL